MSLLVSELNDIWTVNDGIVIITFSCKVPPVILVKPGRVDVTMVQYVRSRHRTLESL